MMPLSADAASPALPVRDVSRDFSRAIERAEVEAWLDLYAAAPAGFAVE